MAHLGPAQARCIEHHHGAMHPKMGHGKPAVTRGLHSQLRPGIAPAAASVAPATSLCAGHVQPLGGASPRPDLMEVRVSKNARATVARRGLKEAWSKCASRWTRTGYKA